MDVETDDSSPAGIENVPGDGILLDDRYVVFSDSPIPEMNIAGAAAYQARDSKNPARTVFARVCDTGVYPRVSMMNNVKSMREANVLQPLHWGTIDWPKTERRAFSVIFDRPEGEPLMSPQGRIMPIKTEDIAHLILHPLVPTFAAFTKSSQPHRAVRLDNIYLNREGRGGCMLGDCVTSPAGWGQPIVYESLETAMTPRSGRGEGTINDDLYALGVALLFLSLGENRVAGFTDEQIIASKLANGTFAALLNNGRPPLGLREPLRGLLADDPSERWSIEDVEQWLGGILRRTSHPKTELKSDRPFEFNGKEYRHCRNLAIAFGGDWQGGARAMRTAAFGSWLKRGFSEESVFEEIEDETDGFDLGGPNPENDPAVLSRVCMALDHSGPIRYKGVVAMPGGIGPALAEAMVKGDKNTAQIIGEMVGKTLPNAWYQRHEFDPSFDSMMEMKRYKRLGQLLKHRAAGYGLERLMYELYQDLPCLSPVLEKEYVYTSNDILAALERTTAKTGKLPSATDRHLLAFISARMKRNMELQMTGIETAKGDPLAAKLAMLTILSVIQFEHGPESAPVLSRGFAKEIEGLADRFHGRTLRERVREKLDSIAATGRLADLANIFNNPARLRRDKASRDEAERKYADAEKRVRELESQEYQQTAQKLGWTIASGISATVAVLAIATVAVW